MSDPLFRSKFYSAGASTKLACVIAGYRGKIKSYATVVADLHQLGYDVVVYEHSATVLTEGDPQKLIDLVDGLRADFAKLSVNYEMAICTGASIGAGLCLALQTHFPIIKFGVYAGAGVSPPAAVFEAPLFYFVRRTFKKRGIDAPRLKSLWNNVDIIADTPMNHQSPFLIVLGKRDKIANYRKAIRTFDAWRLRGEPIKVITQPAMGHSRVIRWYKQNFVELHQQAEQLAQNKR